MSTTIMRRGLGLVACVAAIGAVGAGAANAATPTGAYADFKNCPVGTPDVRACIYSVTNAGSIKLGNTTVPVAPNKLILQGGAKQNPDTFETTFVNPTNGTPALSKTPLNVPGGLTGLIDSSLFGGPLLSIFRQAVAATNDVKATAELVGPVGYSFSNFVAQDGAAVTLPLRIKLDNPFLGSNCYIGSSSNPVTFRLTTGTTNPPPPNRPISGDLGTFTFQPDGLLVKSTGAKLVDNAFAVPAASGCGNSIIDRYLITAAVNLKTGLPSAAGRNSAILQGDLKQADRDAVVASSR